jgi:hypothetical protein
MAAAELPLPESDLHLADRVVAQPERNAGHIGHPSPRAGELGAVDHDVCAREHERLADGSDG